MYIPYELPHAPTDTHKSYAHEFSIGLLHQSQSVRAGLHLGQLLRGTWHWRRIRFYVVYLKQSDVQYCSKEKSALLLAAATHASETK